MKTRTRQALCLAIVILLTSSGAPLALAQGSLAPTNAPTPSMHTLDEIYDKIDEIVIVQTNIVAVTNNTIASIPATGQTNSYTTGDDGDYEKGVAWPNPRFTIGTGAESNCVTDNLTGLVWLRNPDSTKRGWAAAVAYCEALDGTAGRGGFTDWRMPNHRELSSVTHASFFNPAVPNTIGTGQWAAGDPFINILSDNYWTSTTHAADSSVAWSMTLTFGFMGNLAKSESWHVWPVRAGQN